MAFEIHRTVRKQLISGGYKDGNHADLIYIVVNDTAEEKTPFIDAKGIFKLSLIYFVKVVERSTFWVKYLLTAFIHCCRFCGRATGILTHCCSGGQRLKHRRPKNTRNLVVSVQKSRTLMFYKRQQPIAVIWIGL